MYVNYDKRSWHTYQYPEYYSPVENKIMFDNMNPEKPKKSDKRFEACRNLMVICGVTEQFANGKIYYNIRYDFEGKQREFLISVEDMQTRSKLLTALSSNGINVTDDKLLKSTMEYLSKCRKQFDGQYKKIKIAENNGWNDNFTLFAIGNKGINKSKIVPIQTLVTISKHLTIFEPKGTLEGWVDAVNPLMCYDVTKFMFYDAMTAPLLKILDIEPHCFEHVGRTRSGKSTVSAIAASAVGDPIPQMGRPSTTFLGILAHIIGMTDIPTFIEEATSAKIRKVVADAVYEISNGGERFRSTDKGKLRDDIKNFKAVAHITSENPLREVMNNAGEMYRLNSTTKMLPSGMVKEITHCNKQIKDNYGWFFPLYIQCILRNKDNLESMYNKAYDLILVNDELYGNNKDIAESSKKLYAGIIVAGWLCEEVFKEIGIDCQDDVVEVVKSYFKSCVEDNFIELEPIRALKMVHDWTIENYRNFNTESNNITQAVSCYGNMEGEYLDIIGTKFTKLMLEWDFSSTIIKKSWKEEGILKGDDKGFSVTKINGIPTRTVRILKSKMNEKLGINVEDLEPDCY